MRSLIALGWGLVLLCASGCAKNLPPIPPNPPTLDPEAPTPVEAQAKPHEKLPRVVRRILFEEKELVDRSLVLARDLPDPRGKARALAEARALAVELETIEAPLDDADSNALDILVTKLLAIDTRVLLLHEAVRTATNHVTALQAE